MKIYTYENDFAAFVKDNDGSRVLRIDDELYYYWLEVLPPVYMGRVVPVVVDGVTYQKRCSFGFAEGREYITDFWSAGKDPATGEGVYFAKKSTRLNRGY
jgi:hypothetical protein